MAELDLLLILYIPVVSFKFLLSIVAPSIFSLNCKHMFSTSSRRLSVSHAITSLDVRFKNSGRGGKVLGDFLGDLLGLRASAGNTTWGIGFGMWEGVAGTSTSTLGVDCTGPLFRERVLNLLFNEVTEISRIERPLSLGECNVSGEPGGFGHEESGILPFLLPIVRDIPGSSSWTSNDVAGRPFVKTGFCIREFAVMADCGLYNCAEEGRVLALLE